MYETSSENYLSSESDYSNDGEEELREDLQQAKRKLHRILVLEEMKSQNIQHIASILDKSVSTMEEEHSRSMALKTLVDMDAPSPICSHEDLPDDSNHEDAELDEEYDSTSNKKPGKRSSTASRGRGRKSMPRDNKDDELDVIMNNSRGSFGAKRKTRKRRDRKSSPSLLDIDPPDPDEPRYCSCNEISYGEMIGVTLKFSSSSEFRRIAKLLIDGDCRFEFGVFTVQQTA
ncbi:inhibitor of growth protein 2-like [Bolinopsis microptera]|uniref:inhibitor of growth protein 2-like n=1 Tax=Bolinopsis microptera TaxID=2820187 RepID=UPI00307A4747